MANKSVGDDDTSDQILRAERHKAESRAVKWVESLLEPGLSSDVLTEAAMYLEPRHYRDVIDERHIELLCGWPMCSNKLGDVPTARYHVSVRRRVVVDLTQRKKFCSADCFRSSEYYLSQLSTEPVWMRSGRLSTLRFLEQDEDKREPGSKES